MGEETEQINLTIPRKMKIWLDEHREINRSELFRQAVLKMMYPRKEVVPPLVFFISIMGIVFSVALIGIALTPTPMYISIRAVLPILAGVLAISTSLLYYRERKRIKTQ